MSQPAFVIATDLRPSDAAWESVTAQAAVLQASLTRLIGLTPIVDLACLPAQGGNGPANWQLSGVLDRHAANGASELFVVPASFELSVWQRTLMGEEFVELRRKHPTVSLHHDSVDPAYPLLVDWFAVSVLAAIHELGVTPERAGFILATRGQGDPSTRADAYRLMRLIWEQTGVARAEVGFLRHSRPFLREVFERCQDEPLAWVVVPHCQWDGDLNEYGQVLLADHQREHPEADDWRMLDPPRDHPAMMGWLEQRMRRLWQEKRARQDARVPSAKRVPASSPTGVWSGSDWTSFDEANVRSRDGLIGQARDSASLADILNQVLPRADRYLVKVTWHGYAPGTFTGPAALDQLLAALPGPAVILEGHTSGRNLGGPEIDWETNAKPHRAWIRQQELEFLRRTGLSDVIAKHKAQYVNVTEAWWDEECAAKDDVLAGIKGEPLKNPELAEFVPSVLMELRGLPMISFARFKGPTRLGISNLFGLIPHPLRTIWHGTSVADFAAACCDVARIYGSLFPTFGLVEAFESAVRWDRKGLYRSRWGNYDLVLTDGLFTFSEGLPGADILASRLQGQDVSRSSFFGVVRDRLGWSDAAESLPLPIDVQTTLA